MVEGKQFLIQSPSPDWVRRKIFLSDLRDSAVRQHVFGKRKEGIESKRYEASYANSTGQMKSLRGRNVFTDGAAPQLSKAKPASRNADLSHISTDCQDLTPLLFH